jgi:hypothetical protein
MKLEYSRQILEKYSNNKFNENPSSGSKVVPYKRTDTHNEDNSRFSQFCESTKCESCIIDEWITVWFDGWLGGEWVNLGILRVNGWTEKWKGMSKSGWAHTLIN